MKSKNNKKNNWVTITEFRKLEKNNRSEHNYLNYKIDTIAQELKEFRKEFNEFRSYVIKTLDWLVGAFKRLDEERIVESEQHERINKKVDNHESRIQVLERKKIYSS